MLNAKKSASAPQIARDLDMRRPTVWSMMQRVRTAMATDPEQEKLLQGIVGADGTYVDGKPGKRSKRSADRPYKGRRNATKTDAFGAVECCGSVVPRVANPGELSKNDVGSFFAKIAYPARALLIVGRKCMPLQIADLCFKYNEHNPSSVAGSDRLFVGATS
jgi:hypothetical protein